MSKQIAANVIFISQISEKSCTYGITTFWFSQCDFLLRRVFTSPKMRISGGPPVLPNKNQGMTAVSVKLDNPPRYFTEAGNISKE